MVLYFAYGSNMSASQMKKILGWDAPQQAGFLKKFKIVFDQAGFFDSSWSPANIQPNNSDVVEGIIYSLEEKDLKKLDVYERYYERLEVEVVQLQGSSIKAFAYYSPDSKEEKPPSKEYINLALQGRKFLSPGYLEKLKQYSVIG